MQNVICQIWERSEQFNGVVPDGYSIHLSEKDRLEFIHIFWRNMPKRVPFEYEIQSDDKPFKAMVNGTLLQRLITSPRGIRLSRRQSEMYELLGELVLKKMN
jgi:hypothetical protein